VTVPSDVISQRQIFRFWLPLAASWLFMSAEGPVLQAAIARLPDMQTQLAAFGIVMSLEIAIESPVIMLLATSTALGTSYRNYLTLRRFMIWINLLVTVEAILVSFTPLYGFLVRDIMGIPPAIADAARTGMQIMTLWSAAIGFRRFLQGLLIRHGQTRWVGYGTVARLCSSGGGGILLAITTPLPGVSIAGIALMAGVFVEAGFIAWVARPTVQKIRHSDSPADSEILTFGDVARYHAPLAATSLLTLMAQPLIGAGLARMPHASENLAAWPVIWGLLFIFRSPAFALPEAVIALSNETRLKSLVKAFCRKTGLVSSAAMAMLVLTPMFPVYLRFVAGLPPRLSQFVAPAMIFSLALPAINSIHSWFRGLLMSTRRTAVIYWGMGLNLGITTVIIFLGVIMQTPGTLTAVTALTIALIAEVFYLRARQHAA
jgi:progressive ankylosis protein